MALPQTLHAAIQNWKEIDFGAIQGGLDKDSLDIVDRQKASLQGRKKLAEKTKDFRKLPDEDKLAQVKPLLKAYQNEIDQLTTRMKATENAYLEIYRLLGQLPDPVPLFDQLLAETEKLGSIELLESENKLLRKELSDTMRNLSKAKSQESQSAKTKARLEQLENQMEETIQQRTQEKEREIQAETEGVIQHLKDREISLQKQVTEANRKLLHLQASQDSVQAQVIDQYQSYDDKLMARLAETDVLQAELDRANSRIVGLQAANDKLKREATEAGQVTPADAADDADMAGGSHLTRTLELEQNVDYLTQEAERLRRELAVRERATTRLPQVESQLAAKEAEVLRLQTSLKRVDDYEAIKRELGIMKAVEFSLSHWDAGDYPGDDAEELPPGLSVEDSLEKILLETNKKLQSELTHCKNELNDAHREQAAVQVDLAKVRSQLAERETLVATLEDHLMGIEPRVSDATGVVGDDGDEGYVRSEEGPTSASRANLGLAHKAGGSSHPLAAGTSPLVRAATPVVSRNASFGGAGLATGTGSPGKLPLVQIVATQRDRLKTKVQELEDTIERYRTETSELKTELATLKGDNVKLYEKIRYMQSYQSDMASRTTIDMGGGGADATHLSNRHGASSSLLDDDADNYEVEEIDLGPLPTSNVALARTPRTGSRRPGPRNSVLAAVTRKYRGLYEAARNPFEVFQQRESQRQYRSLNAADRVTLNLGRLLLTNKLGRRFLVAYTVLLHFYVTFMVYRTMTTQDGHCDQVKVALDLPGSAPAP
ncbi:hypothetical protein IWQ60_004172 [Tieghemiomyces parasiticus]|uniref:Protein CASP n=1 Tax=Tieghemiomyces parasiticus TaxID=78921 RepID=A0A9W8E008_9FUNG|nr:hypothetical protein IWQ60_004172 [Tieghemiomyces parasiticus]